MLSHLLSLQASPAFLTSPTTEILSQIIVHGGGGKGVAVFCSMLVSSHQLDASNTSTIPTLTAKSVFSHCQGLLGDNDQYQVRDSNLDEGTDLPSRLSAHSQAPVPISGRCTERTTCLEKNQPLVWETRLWKCHHFDSEFIWDLQERRKVLIGSWGSH